MDDLTRHLLKIEQGLSRAEALLTHQGEELAKLVNRLDGFGHEMREGHRTISTRLTEVERRVSVLDSDVSKVGRLEGRIEQLDRALAVHLGQEELAARGFSWAASILGGLIAAGVVGAVTYLVGG